MPKKDTSSWTVEAQNAALIHELCSGETFLEEVKRKDEIAEQMAAQEAKAMRGVKGGQMKFVGAIPASDFFKIQQHQGNECWDDRSFTRDYFNKFTHLKSANV